MSHLGQARRAQRPSAIADFADVSRERPALFAFAGDVYTGFEAQQPRRWRRIDFAQDHVRILSGLYGLLRPLDAIRPYRLEMGTHWAPGRAKTIGQMRTGASASATCSARDLAAADSDRA